jgi:hypothetical protein
LKNSLGNSKNPYLLQHKDNPINWFEWSEEPFEIAKKANLPVFLSIGYSTCHWCHVMAHETFEDDEVANVLNRNFISIKLDREERPDIDNIYMTVCQMLTGSGGWPLTLFLTPDKKPFFAGTYFPKTSNYGRIGFLQLINKITDLWNNSYFEVIESSNNITKMLEEDNLVENLDSEELNLSALKLFNGLTDKFDEYYGGFGTRPKFPTPQNLVFLYHYYKNTNNTKAFYMLEKTTSEMLKGGIYDQVGGGLHRYSTDEKWLLPHFEKMLYDNACFLNILALVYKETKKEEYFIFIKKTLNYLDSKLSDGTKKYYFSSEDADSEGKEGIFYTWTKREILELEIENSSLFISLYNIVEEGNFIHENHKAPDGTNIPYRTKSFKEFAESNNLDYEKFFFNIENSLSILNRKREERVKPQLDIKVLTDWNSILIKSKVELSIALSDNELLNEAITIEKFIFENMYLNGKLFHRYLDGEIAVTGILDDYSFYLTALIALYKSTFEISYLIKAIELEKIINNEFYENGNYYTSSKENIDLIVRSKDNFDNAIQSGSNNMFDNLMELYLLTSQYHYKEKADSYISLNKSKIANYPSAFAHLIAMQEKFKFDNSVLVIANRDIDEEILDVLKKSGVNRAVVASKNLSVYSDYLISEVPTYFVCGNFTCSQPIFDLNELINKL